LFVVSTILALARDNLRFGRWFYLAAAFCGLATGTKMIGLWFFLCVALYLFLGWLHRRTLTDQHAAASLPEPADASAETPGGPSPKRASAGLRSWAGLGAPLRQGALFLVVMILAIVASNPLLTVPGTAKKYYDGVQVSLAWGDVGEVLNTIPPSQNIR